MQRVSKQTTSESTTEVIGAVQVADAIKAYGLTLANYASVREQTIGGFTQVGAHGTGVHLSTVDDQVIAMRLVTPSKGTITLSKVRCDSYSALCRKAIQIF